MGFYSYDINTDVGKVRFLIPDIDSENGEERSHLLDNQEIEYALELNHGDVRRAAADCLDIIATSNTLLFQYMEVLDVKIDAAAAYKQIKYRVDDLRKEADKQTDWCFS